MFTTTADIRLSALLLMLSGVLVGLGCTGSEDDATFDGGQDTASEVTPDTGFGADVVDAGGERDLGVADVPDSMRDSTGSWLMDEGVVDTDALGFWLRSRQYRGWTSSAGVVPSDEGGTRVFINETLANSLMADAESHPVGSIGVRELYADDLVTPRALNLLLKVTEGDGAEGWLWFELPAAAPVGAFSVSEPAAPGCVACHAPAVDFIQSRWPLR